MDWLNLNQALLRSPEFVGEEPVNRATWLCLLAYCYLQENRGRIVACAGWGDRRWQQTCQVTAEEALRESLLWRWEGQDLLVWGYNIAKEEEIKSKRHGGREAAKRRWKAHAQPVEAQAQDSSATNSVNSSPQADPIAEHIRKEGIGRNKKEGIEGNARAREQQVELPPGFPDTEADAKAHAGFVGCPEEFAVEVWNLALSRGGRDAKDVPIRNWRSHLATKWSFKRNADAESSGKGSPSDRKVAGRGKPTVWESKERLAAIASEIDRLKTKGQVYDAENLRYVLPDAVRAELAELKRQRDELQRQLAKGESE